MLILFYDIIILTLSRPLRGGGGGGALEPGPTLNICNFQTVKVITTKFGDFSQNLSENVLTSVLFVYQL